MALSEIRDHQRKVITADAARQTRPTTFPIHALGQDMQAHALQSRDQGHQLSTENDVPWRAAGVQKDGVDRLRPVNHFAQHRHDWGDP